VSDLSPDAVAHLWPVLQIVAAVVGLLVTFVGGLWAGFRWLRGQIRETASELVSPVAAKAEQARLDIARVEAIANAAHRRIDAFTGSDGSGSWRLREGKP